MTVPPSASVVHTERLELTRPTATDVDDLFTICSDPRVWEHYPSLRHVSREQTATLVDGWLRGWAEAGLGVWVVRHRGSERVIGYGGCSVLGGEVWNLGYRLAPEVHGRGFASELALAALSRARDVDAERPIVAYLVENNPASAAVARRVGLTLVDRSPDAGNPDPRAVRLVFSDRQLSTAQLAAARS